MSRYGEAVTKQAVSKWEAGKNFPSLPQFKALCKILGKTADELLFDDAEDLDLQKAIESLEPEEKRAVADAIQKALSNIRKRR